MTTSLHVRTKLIFFKLVTTKAPETPQTAITAPPAAAAAPTSKPLQTVDVVVASLPPAKKAQRRVNKPGQDLMNQDEEEDQMAGILTAKQGKNCFYKEQLKLK